MKVTRFFFVVCTNWDSEHNFFEQFPLWMQRHTILLLPVACHTGIGIEGQIFFCRPAAQEGLAALHQQKEPFCGRRHCV